MNMLRLLPRKPVKIDLSGDSVHDPMLLARRRMMEGIAALNTSATADFLEQFDDEALGRYLEHLEMMSEPRGRESRWVRPHGGPWAFAAAACA